MAPLRLGPLPPGRREQKEEKLKPRAGLRRLISRNRTDNMKPALRATTCAGSGRRPAAFTLIELLVVVAIISLLVMIIMPSLSRAKDLAKQATCLTNVKAQMTAIHLYAAEQNGSIPYGPSFPLFGAQGPPTNTVASNNIWIGPARSYNAHGALLQKHLGNAQAMYCPDDDSADPIEELEKIRQRAPDAVVYCSYFYRQLDARSPVSSPSTMLDCLGNNAAGLRVTALIMDANSLLQIPGVPTRTNHRAENVCVGFAGGHVGKFENSGGNLTLIGSVPDMLPRLDSIFERADSLSQ
jgi:prepilin-type N-terminal cleavage/methylation domain-containing protein